MTYLKELLFSFFFGYNFYIFQDFFGFRNQADGIEYYSEVHHSFQNKICHTIGMPFTMFGAFIWIPAFLFGEYYITEIEYAHGCKFIHKHRFSEHFRNCFMMFYIGVYLQMNVFTTFLVILFYLPSYLYSMYFYERLNRIQNFVLGLSIMVSALYFQEIIGHKWGDDPPSRIAFDPIFNAIIYAPYFSVSHFLV